MLRIFKQYYPIRNIFFILGEGAVVFAVIFFATWRMQAPGNMAVPDPIAFKVILVTAILLACFYYADLYDFEIGSDVRELTIRLLQALGVAALILALIYIGFPAVTMSSAIFTSSALTSLGFVFAWRYGYSLLIQNGLFNQNIVILGDADLAREIRAEIACRKDCGYIVVGPYSGAPSAAAPKPAFADLCRDIQRLRAKKIIVAAAERRRFLPNEQLLQCRLSGIEVLDGNSFYEMLTGKVLAARIQPSWLIYSRGFNHSRLYAGLKRGLDVLASALLLLAALPILILTAVAIKLDARGPVFYWQDRVGRNRRLFRIYKFRSMVEDAEKMSGPVCTRQDDERITRVGRILRKWRLDELPQLANILKGDMSFVGPRPERPFLVEDFGSRIPFYEKRFLLKPGLTGWAQINYGYGDSLPDYIEKFNYELFYLKNMSFLMDLMIILRTIKVVLFRKGAR